MPVFIAALVGALASSAGQIVIKVLLALGIGYISFQGFDFLVESTKNDVMASLGSFSPLTVQLLGVLKVGVCINIMFSAVVIRLTLNGAMSGIKKLRVL